MQNKLFLFMMIFACLAVGITTGCIINHNVNLKNENNTEILSGDKIDTTVENTKPKYTKGIDLYGRYDNNSILLEEIEFKNGIAEGSYYQISGLKDKKVEEKINKDIENFITLEVGKYLNDNTIEKINVYQNVLANFSDVLSIDTRISKSFKEKNEYGDSKYEGYDKGLNYKLTNGEEIKLEELFVDDTDILNLVYSAAYEDLVWESKWSNGANFDDYAEYWESTVTEVDEKELIKIINNFKSKTDTSFYFSPKYITILIKNRYVSLPMKEIYSKVAIYERFISKDSLYEDDSIGAKNIINLSIKYNDGIVYEKIDDKTDNFYFDGKVVNWDLRNLKEDLSGDSILNKIHRKYMGELNIDLLEAEKQALQNKDKTLLVFESYEVYAGRIIEVSKNRNQYLMSNEYYKSNFYDKVIEGYRNNGEGGGISPVIYVYTSEEEPIEKTTIYETRLYSPKTGTELKNIDDYFIKGYDYKTILKQKLNELWNQRFGVYLDEESLEKEFSETEFKVIDYNETIEIYNKNIGYNENYSGYRWTDYKIKFEEFDESQMTI